MLKSLQFVKGAISTKTFEPVLKHFRIKNRHIQAYNGLMSLSAPIDCDLDVQPVAHFFVHAIQLCEDTVSLHLTETGKLAIKSGNFKAYIECSEEAFPGITPMGDEIKLDGNLLEALRVLAPVMGIDASRQWSHGILLAGQSAYVTNNIILIEKWLGYPLPNVLGLPAECVKELLRINEEPTKIQTNGKTVAFHFEGERWLTSALLRTAEWPNPTQLFPEKSTFTEIDESLFKAIQELIPFTDDLNSVWLREDGTVSTSDQKDIGAHLRLTECEGMRGRYSADQFLKIKDIVKRIDWSTYPKPCVFQGENLRGVIIGLITE